MQANKEAEKHKSAQDSIKTKKKKKKNEKVVDGYSSDADGADD